MTIPSITREHARSRGWRFTTARQHLEACHVQSLPPELPLAFPPDDPADWRIVAPGLPQDDARPQQETR